MILRNKYKAFLFDSPFFCFSHSYYGTTDSMVDGRAVRSSSMLTDVPSERFKGLHAVDFCLQNLLAQNVDLKNMSLSDDLFVGHDKCVEFCSSLIPSSNGK